jgi:hypothetical protein
MLSRRHNPDTKAMEFCLIGNRSRNVLHWFGATRPSVLEIRQVEEKSASKEETLPAGSLREQIKDLHRRQ